ncbi:unnamed protein product [Euphydryas editha]|uniref:EGF-like domain-containing protein n=1 Tax=Euphydryas editha TaxID=104508 RepID=A0AAU9V1Q8_EUPED|nr:unnamed protein product [Euphydryas editha]
MRIKFLCLFILCSEIVIFVDGLMANNTGVCVVPRSVQKTRTKKYKTRINKYCGARKCLVTKTKTETYKVTKNESVCCEGWKYDSNSDICSPYCSMGCNGGRCVEPEVCQCDPPAFLDPKHKNTCVTPTCEPPCENGICVGFNMCTCSEGYTNMNGKCKPKCENCANGECISPDNCECHNGYIKTDGVCNPACVGCENGVCTAPNTCKCNEGFIKNDTNNNCYKPCPKNCKRCDIDGICQDGLCE